MSNLSTVEKEFKTILKKREMLTANMNSEISDSWARCISNGLDPFKRPKRSVISFQELEEIRQKKRKHKKNYYSRIRTFVFSSCWHKFYGSLL